MNYGDGPLSQTRWIAHDFIGVSPYGVFEIAGADYAEVMVFHGSMPGNDSVGKICMINGPGGYAGTLAMGDPAIALCDSESIQVGDRLGPKSGTYLLTKNPSGLFAALSTPETDEVSGAKRLLVVQSGSGNSGGLISGQLTTALEYGGTATMSTSGSPVSVRDWRLPANTLTAEKFTLPVGTKLIVGKPDGWTYDEYAPIACAQFEAKPLDIVGVDTSTSTPKLTYKQRAMAVDAVLTDPGEVVEYHTGTKCPTPPAE